jgi:hypothetical protein
MEHRLSLPYPSLPHLKKQYQSSPSKHRTINSHRRHGRTYLREGSTAIMSINSQNARSDRVKLSGRRTVGETYGRHDCRSKFGVTWKSSRLYDDEIIPGPSHHGTKDQHV